MGRLVIDMSVKTCSFEGLQTNFVRDVCLLVPGTKGKLLSLTMFIRIKAQYGNQLSKAIEFAVVCNNMLIEEPDELRLAGSLSNEDFRNKMSQDLSEKVSGDVVGPNITSR